jgi:hypothetical protein
VGNLYIYELGDHIALQHLVPKMQPNNHNPDKTCTLNNLSHEIPKFLDQIFDFGTWISLHFGALQK